MFCRLYGLPTQLNAPLSAVRSFAFLEREAVSLRIALQTLPPGLDIQSRQPWLSNRPIPVSTLLGDGRYACFTYKDGCEFFVARQGGEIWCSWPEQFSTDYIATYLLGPVMGYVLRFRKITCLHASAVSIGGRAVVMLGSPGAGKSTTAAAFACLGFPILSDDIVTLFPHNDTFRVEPAYPRVCLWPSSVEALFGSPEALPIISEGWEKRYLDLRSPGYHFSSEGVPVGAIYVLGERQEGAFQVNFSDLPAREALLELVANTYASYLPMKEMLGLDFQVFSKLLNQVPLRRVTLSDNVTQVKDFASAIANDFMKVSQTSPARI